MNKGEFVTLMAEITDCGPKANAAKAVAWFRATLVAALRRGEDVNLVGLGSYRIRKRAARVGRNPKTGEKTNIPEYNQLVFRASKDIREACNKK